MHGKLDFGCKTADHGLIFQALVIIGIIKLKSDLRVFASVFGQGIWLNSYKLFELYFVAFSRKPHAPCFRMEEPL